MGALSRMWAKYRSDRPGLRQGAAELLILGGLLMGLSLVLQPGFPGDAFAGWADLFVPGEEAPGEGVSLLLAEIYSFTTLFLVLGLPVLIGAVAMWAVVLTREGLGTTAIPAAGFVAVGGTIMAGAAALAAHWAWMAPMAVRVAGLEGEHPLTALLAEMHGEEMEELFGVLGPVLDGPFRYGGMVLFIGFFVMGYTMGRDGRWPGWLALSGFVLGFVGALVVAFADAYVGVRVLAGATMLWLVAVGIAFRKNRPEAVRQG